ncbi:MAG: hypothetical protein QNK23_00730 [Crocinitomicaceae bacterium]|nr:hypothetical protein [Crocinitomicaceae bacterium]
MSNDQKHTTNGGFAVLIAWPETYCRQADAWYDGVMNVVGINKQGYYKVGHAAIVLINAEGECHYFDFGRYNTPPSQGRVRSAGTDDDLHIFTRIGFDDFGKPMLKELVDELQENRACNGAGKIRVGVTEVNFENAYDEAIKWQSSGLISYGPFVPSGTNCSRFARNVAIAGMESSMQKMRLSFPPMITPTPMWNVMAVNEYYAEREMSVIRLEI